MKVQALNKFEFGNGIKNYFLMRHYAVVRQEDKCACVRWVSRVFLPAET